MLCKLFAYFPKLNSDHSVIFTFEGQLYNPVYSVHAGDYYKSSEAILQGQEIFIVWHECNDNRGVQQDL